MPAWNDVRPPGSFADERKRKELMIIYGEDLAPTGFSAADLSQSGKEFV